MERVKDLKYWQGIKFACAMALIRSKPLHLSGKKYAEHLHSLYWRESVQFNWQNDAHECHLSRNAEGRLTIFNSLNKIETGKLRTCTLDLQVLKRYLTTFQALLPYTDVDWDGSGYVLFAQCKQEKLSKSLFIQTLGLTACLRQSVHLSSLDLANSLATNLLLEAVACVCKFHSIYEEKISGLKMEMLSKILGEIEIVAHSLLLQLMESDSSMKKAFCCTVLVKMLQDDSLKWLIAKQLVCSIKLTAGHLKLASGSPSAMSPELKYNFTLFNNSSFVFHLLELFITSLWSLSKNETVNESNATRNLLESGTEERLLAENPGTSCKKTFKHYHVIFSICETLNLDYLALPVYFPMFTCYAFKLRLMVEGLLQNI